MKLNIIIILFLTFSSSIFSQNTHYTILTFEHTIESIKKTTYWIVENKSIQKHSEIELSPLYLNLEYTTYTFNMCCAGVNLDYINETKDNSLYFSDEHLSIQFDYVKMLKKNRKLLQKIFHNYSTGIKSSLKVFATPIIGDFCICNALNNQPFGFIVMNTKTFIPKTLFKNDVNFWMSTKSKRIRYYDFSKYLFESFH